MAVAINCVRSQQDHRDAKNRRINRLLQGGQLGQITNEFAWLVLTEVHHRPRWSAKREEKRTGGGGFLRAGGPTSWRKFPLSFQIFPGARRVASRSLIIYVREDVTIETRVEAFSGYGETFWPKGRHLCTFRSALGKICDDFITRAVRTLNELSSFGALLL